MKKLFWAMCLLTSPVLAQAQVLLQGIVVDSATREPLAGVTLTLEKGGATQTNQEGGFTFYLGKGGGYTLHVTSIGYRSETLTVRGGRTQIALSRIDLFLQPIEVKALRAGDKAPFSTTTAG